MSYNVEEKFCRNFRMILERHYPRQERRLAETLNISPAQINNVKHGRRAGTESWRRWVADELGVSYEEMIELGKPSPDNQDVIVMAVSPDKGEQGGQPGYRKVPLHETARLLKGVRGPHLDQRSSTEAAFIVSLAELHERADHEIRALRVTDDSMWPRLPEGSIIFVDVNDRRFSEDRLYITLDPASISPMGVIRRVRRVAQGKSPQGYLLTAENPRYMPEMTEMEWEELAVGRIVWIWRNVEGVQAEPQYQKVQKLESVEWLAGGVAYQLNNALSPIMGYGEMAMEQAGENEELKAHIREMMDASQRAKALGRQLLAFSRQKIQDFSSLDINEVLRNAEHVLLRPVLPEKVTLRMELASRMQTVKADEGQVEQILINLINNALDAMPEGGRITIVTDVVDLNEDFARQRRGAMPGRYVLMSVSDTGEGMDQETLERVFEPFFTTKTSEHNAGLGLSNTYGIVKQHGGNIWAYSEPGLGSTFKVYLPVAPEEVHKLPVDLALVKAPGKIVTETDSAEEGTIVLLVEDERTVRYMCYFILKKAGYKVLVAKSGAEAVSVLNRHEGPLHFLLTDVILPDLHGNELYQQVSSRYPDLSVLYMSGYAKNVIVYHGILRPNAPFLQKPFGSTELVARVEEILYADSQAN
ncbi:MAG: ATP-binding protein [Desulfobacterales bacterium]